MDDMIGTTYMPATRYAFESLLKICTRQWRKLFPAIWMILVLLGFLMTPGGCAFRSAEIPIQALDYPPPDRDAHQAAPDTLMVYRFLTDPGVDDYALSVSSTDGENYRNMPRWRNHPADMMTDLIRRDLEKSGLFKQTVDHFSTAPYRYALEGTLRELGAVTGNGKSTARVQLDIKITDFDAPRRTGKILLNKAYRSEIPIVDLNPETVLAALNRGAGEISSQLRSDIRTALPAGKAKLEQY